jgi:hypothetical protein
MSSENYTVEARPAETGESSHVHTFGSQPRRLRRPPPGALWELAAGAVAFAAVGGLGADHGGYFPTTWGWAAVALCAIAATLLVVCGAPRLGSLEKAVLAAMVGLSAWSFISSFWSTSTTRSMLDGERSLVYVSGVVVAIMLSRRANSRAVVTGTWLGITAVCTYSLLTRLFPRQFGEFDPLEGNRLSAPIGYWNGLGLLAVIGCLLALGLAARGRTPARMAAAASTVILVLTLYFTFGRGAWIALAAGLVAAIIVDARRLQFVATALAVAPWPALAVYLASQSESLTGTGVSIDSLQKDGHALAVIAVFLMTLAALALLALDAFEQRHRPSPGRRERQILVGVCVVALAAVVAVGLARFGSPVTIARNAWDGFVAPPKIGTNLNERFFHLSGTGRIDHWRVAEEERALHPWLGSGAGTFAEYWFRLRPSRVIVHDAHNLYLETLAETGPVGLALLVLLLGGLIVGAARSTSPLAPVAVGGCVAFGLHAIADWDWELPALFLAVLLPAVSVIGEGGPQPVDRLRRRFLPTAAVVALGAFAVFTLLGNIALARSGNASDATNWRQAENEARSAMDLAPWSAEPWRKLAVAQAGLGDIQGAQDSLREAAAMEPADWSLWYQLAQVSAGALRRHALAEARRLNPNRTSREATPGDLRLVVIP